MYNSSVINKRKNIDILNCLQIFIGKTYDGTDSFFPFYITYKRKVKI